MADSRPSILLIDDNADSLYGLRERLSDLIGSSEVDIKTWIPNEDQGSPKDVFDTLADSSTALVVTDYDLTPSVRGLFGLTIVGWCQARSIPVGDFSRGNKVALPKEPNLFELRIPTDGDHDASFIAMVFRGFLWLRAGLEVRPEILKEQRSLASVLSALLKRPNLERQFAAYMSRLGAANSFLLQQLREFAGPGEPDDDDKKKMLVYVLGHVLLNAILKYPGPILSCDALCAYVATDRQEAKSVEHFFSAAKYDGPFSGSQSLFWREDVDSILSDYDVIDGMEFDSFADVNRSILEAALGRPLKRHACDRCGGVKGGFWCPFTLRPVCERADCSVPSSSWIPSGAQLCRIEREYYDEWAPVLGM